MAQGMNTDPAEGFVLIHEGKGEPSISFLMPIYNQSRYIRESVRSVLAQQDVTIEVLLSDDNSDDDTFIIVIETIKEWIATRGCRHRIRVRKSSARLWRDHLPLLIDNASCDIVCQAHGDDLFHPQRALAFFRTFSSNPSVALTITNAEICKTEEPLSSDWSPLPPTLEVLSFREKEIVEGRRLLIGFNQAWRRSRVSCFPRLDRNYSAVGHDRILPLRAYMNGLVVGINALLMRRRVHPRAAHTLMFDEPSSRGTFGWAIATLAHIDAMERDANHAFQIHLIDNEMRDRLHHRIAAIRAEMLTRMISAHREYTRDGLQIAWVDDKTLVQLREERTKAGIA